MPEPIKLIADAFYDDGDLTVGLKLSQSALDRGRKSGELRYTKRGGRVLYLGQWVHQWLSAEPAECLAVPA